MAPHSAAARGTLPFVLVVLLLLAIPLAVAQDDFLAQARVLKAKGDVNGAIALLEQGLANDPDNASAHYVVGWLYVGKGDQTKAAAAFRRVVELSPDTEEGREAKAALERMGASAAPEPGQEQPVGPTEDPGDLARLGPRPRMDGPIPTITIDPVRSCPMIDGEPFFAIGCYGIPPEQMQTAAEAGFNLTVRWGWWGRPNTQYGQVLAEGPQAAKAYLHRYLDAARDSGLWVLETPMLFTGESLLYGGPDFAARFDRFAEERLPQVVETVKDHPALFGYYGLEEFRRDLKVEGQVSRFTHVVRQHDADHPIVLLVTAHEDWVDFLGEEGWDGWDATLEVAANDWYPKPHLPSQMMVSSCAARNAILARGATHAYWWVPLVNWALGAHPYPLSPNAQRVQVYLALIGGANGIVWWMWPPRHIDQWNVIRQVNQEMRALEPVLLEPLTPTRVEWEPPELSDTIQARAIRHGEKTWLLTANASGDGATAGLRLPTKAQRARVWFENREVRLEDGVLVDRFEGFDRHVYEIAATWADDAAIKIDARLDALPTEYGPWPGHGFEVSEENLLADPGFEEKEKWPFTTFGRPLTEAQGDFDTADPFAGAASAVIERMADPVIAVWFGPMLELKPHTRYLFGGCARSEAPYPSEAQIQVHQLHGTHASALKVLYAEPESPWTRYSALFATSDGRASDGRVWASASVAMDVGFGTARFDELFLHEACPGIRNLVANGGFEGPEVAKGWPINWHELYSLEIPGHIASDDPLWGVDHGTAYEGNNSLRMVHPGDAKRGGKHCPRACQYLVPGTVVKKGQPYVFSAYMKADRPNLLVQTQVGYRQECVQDLRIGTEWQRYVVRVAPAETIQQPHVAVWLLKEGTLWIDAVQFEPGTEATEYQEWWY